METKAFMLRNDGKAFPCSHHLYVMHDDDLSSEAEVAAFIYTTNSADKNYAAYVLNCWMALLIEDSLPYDYTDEVLQDTIAQSVKSLPYRFLYPISIQQLLEIQKTMGAYSNIDEFYEYCDEIRSKLKSISTTIERSLNQQFCRVRYGGQYDSVGTSDIWFRISSVGFNWSNIIYQFTADNYRRFKVDRIFICRDYESDNGEVEGKAEYFYRAKDGSVYFDMPIQEFLSAEHESNPVFSFTNINRGVLASMYGVLSQGRSYVCAEQEILHQVQYDGRDPWPYFVREESAQCLDCSDFLERASARTHTKVHRITSKIMDLFPEISEVGVDIEPHENTSGNMVGVKYIFDLSFHNPNVDDLQVDVNFNKGDVTPDVVFRRFRQEYSDYKKFMGLA